MIETGIRQLLFIFFIVITLCSCELRNKEEQVPSYISIDTISLTTTSPQGSKSSKITDAWVFVSNEFIGAFQLPATFPVLQSGQQEIKILAGVKENGISATRIEYPLYSFYSSNIQLIPGSTIHVSPNVAYFPAIQFPWLEDFESAGFNIADSPLGTDTSLQATSDPLEVFEGTKSGVAYLDDTHTRFECVSSSSFTLPKSGSAIFLELNYKSNNPFVVGFFGSTNAEQIPALQINPSTGWNKIYINLTEKIGSSPSSSFRIFIGMIKDPSVAKPALFLDNIKLAHQ